MTLGRHHSIAPMSRPPIPYRPKGLQKASTLFTLMQHLYRNSTARLRVFSTASSGIATRRPIPFTPFPLKLTRSNYGHSHD